MREASPLSRFLTLAVLASILTLPVAASQQFTFQGFEGYYTHPTSLEIGEPNAADRALEGQKNCVLEATTGPTASCPVVTRTVRPFAGVRILDAMAAQEGWQDPWGDLETTLNEPGNAFAIPASLDRGSNTRAATGDRVQEVVLPGRYTLWAWYGVWNDSDADRDVRVAFSNGKAAATNEWIPESGATLYAYIEPGPRPPLLSSTRPHRDTPDVTLLYHGDHHAHRSVGDGLLMVGLSPIVFVDGSLLQEIRTTTISEAILAPDGPRPYTLTANSLVDIDVAPAVADGPVSDLYEATLAPTVNAVGSPSLGSCPGQCRVGLAAATGSPLEGPIGHVAGGQYVVVPREWAESSGSSSAGRRDAHNESYAPWADLVVSWAPWSGQASRVAGPVPGRSADGGPSAAPGVLVFEAWAGLWKDLDRDGYVGAPGDDPYAGGTRPAPDDYANPSGEFHGVWPSTPSSPARVGSVGLTLIPYGSWEDVVVLDNYYGSPKCGNQVLLDALLCAANGQGVTIRGHDPMRFFLTPRASDQGRLVSTSALLLPSGSPGFMACTDAMYVRHGVADASWIQDCDDFGRWEGRT